MVACENSGLRARCASSGKTFTRESSNRGIGEGEGKKRVRRQAANRHRKGHVDVAITTSARESRSLQHDRRSGVAAVTRAESLFALGQHHHSIRDNANTAFSSWSSFLVGMLAMGNTTSLNKPSLLQPLIRLPQTPPQRALVPRHKLDLVVSAHAHQAGRIRAATHGMRVHLALLHNLKAAQHPQEHKVQLAVRQQRARAHPVPQPVREQRRVGRFEPALGTERLGVGPDVRVCGALVETQDD